MMDVIPMERVEHQKFVDLSRCFVGLWDRIAPGHDPYPYLTEITQRYAEPHRHYHTLEHVADCLMTYQEVSYLLDDPEAVECAIWYHDIIYDVTRGDNEEQSAILAGERLRDAGAATVFRRSVESLIRDTTHIDIPHANDGRYMVDIDMAILGSEPERFREYERCLKEEYVPHANIPEEKLIGMRKGFLNSLLKKGHIYHTHHFRESYENQARENIHRSLVSL